MPDSHRRHLEWTPGRILRRAEETGLSTAKLAEGVLASRPHPEQASAPASAVPLPEPVAPTELAVLVTLGRPLLKLEPEQLEGDILAP